MANGAWNVPSNVTESVAAARGTSPTLEIEMKETAAGEEAAVAAEEAAQAEQLRSEFFDTQAAQDKVRTFVYCLSACLSACPLSLSLSLPHSHYSHSRLHITSISPSPSLDHARPSQIPCFPAGPSTAAGGEGVETVSWR